jgi:hypothetical protein
MGEERQGCPELEEQLKRFADANFKAVELRLIRELFNAAELDASEIPPFTIICKVYTSVYDQMKQTFTSAGAEVPPRFDGRPEDAAIAKGFRSLREKVLKYYESPPNPGDPVAIKFPKRGYWPITFVDGATGLPLVPSTPPDTSARQGLPKELLQFVGKKLHHYHLTQDTQVKRRKPRWSFMVLKLLPAGDKLACKVVSLPVAGSGSDQEVPGKHTFQVEASKDADHLVLVMRRTKGTMEVCFEVFPNVFRDVNPQGLPFCGAQILTHTWAGNPARSICLLSDKELVPATDGHFVKGKDAIRTLRFALRKGVTDIGLATLPPPSPPMLPTSDQGLDEIRDGNPLHQYRATVRLGEPIWIYSVLDFSKKIAVDAICATSRVRFKDGVEVEYPLRGVRLDDALFMTEDSEAGGAVSHIAIYPYFFSKSYGKPVSRRAARVCHGLAFHQDWDEHPEFAPCLVSSEPLIEELTQSGQVTSHEVSTLENIWATEMERTPIHTDSWDRLKAQWEARRGKDRVANAATRKRPNR